MKNITVTLGGQITADTRLYAGSGTEIFFIQQATGEVCIGTTNPGYKLDVAGEIRAGTEFYKGSIALGATGSSNTTSGASLIGAFDEFTNSDSTTVQDVLDDLDSSIGTAAADAITAVGNITSGSAFTSTVPGSSLYFTDTGFLGLGSATARISFDDASPDEIELLGGNVGIGSTTPSSLLSVGPENQLTVDSSGNLFTLGTGSFIGALSAPTINTGLGAFEIRLATDTLTGLAAFTDPHFDVASGIVSIAASAITGTELASTTVTAGTYGSVLSGTSGFYPSFTVDADGRLTAASTVPFTFESPLAFTNGLTRSTNSVALGGQITGDTRLYAGSGTEIFFIQQATGEVGIGTTNPGYKLDVAGSIRAGTELYIGSIGLGSTNSCDSGSEIIGVYRQALTNSNPGASDLQTVLEALDSSIGASGTITAVGNITSGSAFPSTVPGSSLYFTDTGFLGLGSATARISFDDASPDEIELLGGNVGIGSTTPSSLLSVGPENQLTVDSSGNLFTLGTGSFIGALSAPTINTGLGAFEIRLATDTLTGLAAFTDPHFDVASGIVSIAASAITGTELASTTVTAGTYGSVLSGTSGFYPSFTVDADGRLTAASTVPFTFESPLAFTNGLTRSTNSVALGGQITGDTRLYGGSGTEIFFIQQATGEVGIGTTNPGYKLDVAGSIRAGTELYIGSIGLGSTNSCDSGSEIIGVYRQALTNSNPGASDLQTVLEALDSSIGASGTITAVGNITSGSAFPSTVPGSSLYFTDTGFLGLGSATARISFDDASPDEIELLGGNVGIGSTTPSSLLSVGPENQLTVDSSGNLFTLGTGSFIGALSAPTINTGLGAFEIRLATDTLTGLAAFTDPHFDVASGIVSIAASAITGTELASTTVTAGTYGSVLSGTSGF